MQTKVDTKKMTTLGLLAAISVVLIAFRVPFPPAPFLEYDPADVPILISTYIYGPGAGVIVTIIASAIQAMTVSASSGWIGFVMHVIATGTMCIVVGKIYNVNNHSTKRLIIANVAGSLAMAAMMVVANLIFIPIFSKVPMEQVVAMIAPIILPFNLLKAAINSVIAALVFLSIKKTIGV